MDDCCNNCFAAFNVIKLKIPGFSVTGCRRGLAQTMPGSACTHPAEEQIRRSAFFSVSVPPERLHLRGLWAIWRGPSALRPLNYISYDVSVWAPTAPRQPTPLKQADPANAQIQMCIGTTFPKRPLCSLTRDKSQQVNRVCLCPYLFHSSSSWGSLT